MTDDFWLKQTPSKPLFPDIEWNKPEQRSRAGKLGIIGGNKLGFAGVAAGYETALTTGVGEVRVLLPDALRTTIPKQITDTVFAASTPSGSLSKDALPELQALGVWAQGILLIGDAGRNSETAIAYEQFISSYDGPLTLTRDAIDLVKNSPSLLVERPETLIVGSFAQIQKLFQAVYYPKMLTFSMRLMNLADTLHKFTISYPVAIATLHDGHLLIAHGGRVVTQEWDSPLRIWRGETAAKMASYWLWSRDKPLEAVITAVNNPQQY